MIAIPYTKDHTRNQERAELTDGALPCIVCGRAVKAQRPAMVRVFWGSHIVTDAEAEQIIAEEGAGGDLYYYPIGPDCLRRHPELASYAHKSPPKIVDAGQAICLAKQ